MPKGLCIDFIDSSSLIVVVSVDLFVVSATHKFAPSLLEFLRVGLSSNRKTVLGIIDCRHCHQLFIHLRLKFVITLSYIVFLLPVIRDRIIDKGEEVNNCHYLQGNCVVKEFSQICVERTQLGGSESYHT